MENEAKFTEQVLKWWPIEPRTPMEARRVVQRISSAFVDSKFSDFMGAALGDKLGSRVIHSIIYPTRNAIEELIRHRESDQAIGFFMALALAKAFYSSREYIHTINALNGHASEFDYAFPGISDALQTHTYLERTLGSEIYREYTKDPLETWVECRRQHCAKRKWNLSPVRHSFLSRGTALRLVSPNTPRHVALGALDVVCDENYADAMRLVLAYGKFEKNHVKNIGLFKLLGVIGPCVDPCEFAVVYLDNLDHCWSLKESDASKHRDVFRRHQTRIIDQVFEVTGHQISRSLTAIVHQFAFPVIYLSDGEIQTQTKQDGFEVGGKDT